MTTVVQTVAAQGLGGVANKTFTLSATASGGSIIVTLSIEAGATGYTGFTVTDNQSNAYVNAALLVASARTVAIYHCLGATAGVTSVVVTGTGGTGGMFGSAAVQEVSGLVALDQHATAAAPGASPMTLNNAGADTSATDFVTTVISIGNGAANCGISDPPTGYTTSAINQVDTTDAGGACAYRINSTAVTDSVAWAATSWLAGAPAAIASYSSSAAAAAVLVPWQQKGQMGVQLAS